MAIGAVRPAKRISAPGSAKLGLETMIATSSTIDQHEDRAARAWRAPAAIRLPRLPCVLGQRRACVSVVSERVRCSSCLLEGGVESARPFEAGRPRSISRRA